MKVTVIPDDHWIRRDDQAVTLPNWPFDDANIHAIQWEGDAGEMEFKGNPRPSNETFTDAERLAPYLEAMDEYLLSLAAE